MDNKEYCRNWYHKMVDIHKCVSCGIDLPSDAKFVNCDPCHLKRKKSRSERKPWREERYNISTEQYNEMLKQQNNLCPICNRSLEGTKRIHIDHDHITGKVREILHAGCNHAVGFYEKYNQNTIRHYINKHKCKIKPFVLEMIKNEEWLRLDVGCGKHPKEGFIKLDKMPLVDPDIEWDLEDLPIPLPDNCVKEVWANYSISSVYNHHYVMNDIWRICRPEATVQVNVPHCGWDGAYGDPLQKSYFNQYSWTFWDSRQHASADWGIESMYDLVDLQFDVDPILNFLSGVEREYALKFYRNIIQKIKFTLRAVK